MNNSSNNPCVLVTEHTEEEAETHFCIDGMNAMDANAYQNIRWWLEGVLHIIICVIGFVANSVSVRVLLAKEMKNLFNITLAILAVCDAIYTLCDVLDSIRIVHYDVTPCLPLPLHQKIHLHVFPYVIRPLRYVSMVSSIYTTIIVAMERYVAVSQPISSFVGNFEGQGKWKRALLYTIPIFLLSISFSVPKYLEFQVESIEFLCYKNEIVEKLDESTSYESLMMAHKGCYHVSSHLHLNATALRLNPDYILYYVNVAQNVVTGLIPLISLVVLNYLVYTHLVKRRKGIHWLGVQSQVVNQVNLELRQAQTLFGVVALFFIGHTLRIILNLQEIWAMKNFNDEQNRGCVSPLPFWNNILLSISRLLCAISHSANLLIYCWSSAHFRVILYRKLFCKPYYIPDPSTQQHIDRVLTLPTTGDTRITSIRQLQSRTDSRLSFPDASLHRIQQNSAMLPEVRLREDLIAVFHRNDETPTATAANINDHTDVEMLPLNKRAT